MANNRQLDTQSIDRIEWPYSRIENPLSPETRIVSGLNTFTTLGGVLSKRPGTIDIANTASTRRCDRLWLYETLDTPPRIYILGSFYNPANAAWQMEYIRLDDAVPAWTSVGTLRSVHLSRVPHEVVISKGLAYIKCIPTVASGEKLGTIIFDGTGGVITTNFWGVLGPTTPMAINGAVTKLSAAVTSSATTFNVDDTSTFPAAPFSAHIEFEEVTVSAKTATTFTVTRAVNGTTAAAHVDNTPILYHNFAASDHAVDVNLGWKYSYCYKTNTGHYSNRAPLETNPDKLPSNTGPFIDAKPSLTYTGHSDTTRIPKIAILRTTDGGGTFYILEEITNPGAGTQTYVDDSLGTGATSTTFNDPLPDDLLGGDNSSLTPSLISNSVPPTVLAPLVTGTDTPAQSTPIVNYSGRLWFGIGNTLFYSANEELNTGIPEEAWPSGLFGNFFRFQYPLTNLMATKDALYVFTLKAVYTIDGTNKETFSPSIVLGNTGHPFSHPRAITRVGEKVAFISHDFRVLLIENNKFRAISDPLSTDIVNAIADGTVLELVYWSELEKEWLMVLDKDTAAINPRQWTYDFVKSRQQERDFWFTPWSISATASTSGRIKESSSNTRLLFYIWDNSVGRLVYLDSTAATLTDVTPAGGTTGYTVTFDTSFFTVPLGNHVNERRAGAMTPVLSDITINRTEWNGDTDPDFYYFSDDLWTDPKSVKAEIVQRRDEPKGYRTLIYPIDKAMERAAFRITKESSNELFELLNIRTTWNPDAGD